jgi:hypothetical protein
MACQQLCMWGVQRLCLLLCVFEEHWCLVLVSELCLMRLLCVVRW